MTIAPPVTDEYSPNKTTVIGVFVIQWKLSIAVTMGPQHFFGHFRQVAGSTTGTSSMTIMDRWLPLTVTTILDRFHWAFLNQLHQLQLK